MTSSRLVIACLTLSLAMLVPAAAQQPRPERVDLRVLLPDEHAKLLVDGMPTKQTGAERHFHSPPLEAGHTYAYTVTTTWDPNNYTTVIRTRTIRVKAGQQLDVDLRNPDPDNPDKFHIRYVPTPDEVVEKMCKLARVGKDDVVYDLGCGDGRIVISAVKDFGAKRGVGVDLDASLVEVSRKSAKEAKVADKVEFRKADVLDLKDLSDATVVMLYMGEDVNLRLRPILQKSLKPGSRIVSHDFSMGDWQAEKKITVLDDDGDEHILYLWTIGK